MIHYSSINDAWGNKETFKNNKLQTDIKYNIDDYINSIINGDDL